MKKSVKLATQLAVFALVCSSFLTLHSGAQTPAAQAANNAGNPQIEYRNNQFGFCFALPASWKGYSIVARQWNGTPLDGGPPLSGSELLIRHPAWTEQNPREDIPIMIFTAPEWQRVQKQGVSVSAAPIGPSELGHNRRYMFALPARWDFDELPGQEEADQVVAGQPLRAPCARLSGRR